MCPGCSITSARTGASTTWWCSGPTATSPPTSALPLVADRAVLVPTAEEDPAIDLGVLLEFFDKPAGYVFLTPEERDLVSSRALHPLRHSVVAGIGLEPVPLGATSRAPIDHLGIPEDYLLYLGRVDRNKGCDALLENFQEYASTRKHVTLVLAGPAKMQVPEHPQIRALGYVSDEVRSALLAHARALVVPSWYESLSIVLLEAWNYAVPALVNGRCKVLAGQVTRANGGLYYMFPAEFDEAADYLLTQRTARDAMGRQGLAYIDREYRWPTVIARVESLLHDVQRRAFSEGGPEGPPLRYTASPGRTRRTFRSACNGQRNVHEPLPAQPVGTNLQRGRVVCWAGDEIDILLVGQVQIRRRWHGGTMRMGVIDADDLQAAPVWLRGVATPSDLRDMVGR